MGRKRSMMMAAVVAGSLVLGTAQGARADNSFARDFGLGLASVGASIFYMPAKLVYATLGGITGGFAYALTGANLDVGRSVWVPSMGGDYVVTPSMIRGEEPIMFSGTTARKQTAVAYSAAPRHAAPPAPAPAPAAERGANETFGGY